MQLTAHFSLEELIASEWAMRHGVPNHPGPEEINNLLITAMGMEQCRAVVGQPIYVLSGYRSQRVNAGVGSNSRSDHLKGLACDWVCPGYGPPKVCCKAIRDSDIQFSQLIYEGNWVHIAFAEPRDKREVLTAKFDAHGVTYREGIV